MSKPFSDVVLALVREDGPDLSLRQCAVLMLAAQTDPLKRPDQNTIRALAAGLRVSKPAVTRAMDRLTNLGFGERHTDTRDRRSVFFVPSGDGMRMAQRLGVAPA